ncbi:aminotransferase class III-fold pyridoxal phosphate-dependent enzyme [Actinokineospora guangxiensis]|uniref:Aminotransferase class III-fold pyridoxal phosphate-dependent enzyme n=1 Tax=Actinokineospora guangxiensis TaxID=1490288 RepID=A0ABW0EVE0_9PSEU
MTAVAGARIGELPVVDRAEGCWIYDVDGNDYLDGSSGTLCVNIGHGVREVLDAMAEQGAQVCFTHRSQFESQPRRALTEEIHAVTGNRFREIVYTNSGSEATETALRLVLHHHNELGTPDRVVVLSQYPSYHGMTAGALGISGHPARRRNLGGLLAGAADLALVAPADPDALVPDASDWSAALERVGADRVAAIMVEPVGCAASGGAVVPDQTWRDLRELCDRTGTLLVADEVMTGFGRTGAWLAHTGSGVLADLVATGKGLSAGYSPLGACLVGDAVLRGRSAATAAIGHTMNGNPLSAAAALAVLRYLTRHGLVDRARAAGELLRLRLDELAGCYDWVGPPRGRGLVHGLPLHQSAASYAVEPLAHRVCAAARACGLVVYPAGVDHRTQSLLVAPPLTISDDELDELVRRLDSALRRTAEAQGASSR